MPSFVGSESPRSGLGPYRSGDYFALPEEPRCELLYGRLLVTPAPSARHQRVLLRLARELAEAADLNGGEVLVSPIDVVLAEHTVVQPDLIFLSAQAAAHVRDRVEGPPDLVVEILSTGSARRDLGEKLRLYAECGVGEYWVIDPAARTIERLANRDGEFVVRLPAGGRHRSEVAPGFELDPELFWSQIRE